jgi:hypothetical protein
MDDFEKWMKQTFRRAKQHVLTADHNVYFGQNQFATILTAEQARRLAEHLLALASANGLVEEG